MLMDWQADQLQSVVHILITRAVIGIFEGVDIRIHNFGRKTVPAVDHSLAEEKFPCILF